MKRIPLRHQLRRAPLVALLISASIAAPHAVAEADNPEQKLAALSSIAQPNASATVDVVLAQLARLGPKALVSRVSELKTRAAVLRQLGDTKRGEADALDREAEGIEAFTASLSRLNAPNNDAPAVALPPVGSPWTLHTIEAGLRKSEGIRLGDINGDGRPDLSVAWEGQEISRVYLNPGAAQAASPWPAVTVATTPNIEDAAFIDIDRDGRLDVISSLEKGTEKVTVSWSPQDPNAVLNPTAWEHAEFLQVAGVSMWMYAEAIQLAPGAPTSLVIGGKNYKADASAALGLLVAPSENPRDLSRWEWRPLTNVSWVMSIEATDVDGDGLQDILYTDKHGPLAGVHWLKNPGADTQAAWVNTALTDDAVKSANFLTSADLDKDGLTDIVALVETDGKLGAPDNEHRFAYFLRRTDAHSAQFETHLIAIPPGIGSSKGITVGDVDLDGRNDIVLTSSGAEGDLIGTSWLRYENTPLDRVWRAYNIAGPLGTKYDLVYLIDLDDDGDLDVLANDEKQDTIGLGVFWYENPTINKTFQAKVESDRARLAAQP